MMNLVPTLDIYTVKVAGIPVYECAVCGRRARGSTVRLDLQSFDDFERAVANISNAHLPVGWAGYGLGVAHCPAHII